MPFSQYNKSDGGTSKWGSSSTSKGSGGGASKWGSQTKSKSAAAEKKVETTAKKKVEVDEDKYSTEKTERSIENAKTRIKDSGYKVKKDERNWVEKKLNLPQKQNWFFDTLDVLGRPQQALYAGAKALVKGDNVKAHALMGLTGNEVNRGSEFVEKAGIDNKYAKAILGFGLDVVADPVNLIPGGAIAKGFKATTKPVTAGYKALEKASPALKTAREAAQSKVAPVAQTVKDGLGKAFKYQYGWNKTLDGAEDNFLKDRFNQTQNNISYQTEEMLREVADNAKSAGGADKGEQVGRLLEKNLRQFEDVKGYEFPDGVRRTENKSDLLNAISTNKDQLKSIGKDVNQTRREFDKAISGTAQQLEKIDKEIRRFYFSQENKALRQLNKRKNVPLNLEELASQKAFGEVSASPKLNLLLQKRDEFKGQLDDLRKQSEQARIGSINKIKDIVNQNNLLKEATKNPVIIQKELSRPLRDMPTDPNINKAADNLMKSNNTLRNWAKENGIGIKELEGYMTHILSAEERTLQKTGKAKSVDRGNFGTGQPNKSILNTRQLTGSAEDINERFGRKFFEPNAFFATAIGQKRLIEYGNAVKFRREVLSNTKFAKKYEKGMMIPHNAEKIDTNNYKFLKDDAADALGLADEIGGEYVVTKGVKEALDRYQKLTTDEGVRGVLKAFDTLQSGWKKFALFSPGYHIRNVAGGLFNSFVGGMNPDDLVKYGVSAQKEVMQGIRGNESKLFNEYRRQGLSSTNLSKLEFRGPGDPEKAITKVIKERSKKPTAQIGARLNPLRAFETSRELGDYLDQVNRFAMFKWAVEKKGMTPARAAEKVRETHFDYSRITNAEKEIGTRLMPFYRWMRFNLPFQVQQFVHDPRRYMAVNKARLNLQESMGIEEEKIPDYMKESFAVPITGDEKGKGKLLGLNLPLSDLTKLSHPGKTLVDSTSPLLKLPAELILNRNFFYDKPIAEFKDQKKQFKLPGTGIEFGIPAKQAYAAEQLTGQVGRGFSQYLQKPEEVNQDTKFRMPSFGISNLTKEYDVDKENYYRAKQQLKELQDYIDYIEQQTGKRPREVREIKGPK